MKRTNPISRRLASKLHIAQIETMRRAEGVGSAIDRTVARATKRIQAALVDASDPFNVFTQQRLRAAVQPMWREIGLTLVDQLRLMAEYAHKQATQTLLRTVPRKWWRVQVPTLPVKEGQLLESIISEAFDESEHPRDDHGRFISKGDIELAIKDDAKAKELFDKTTDPKERAKLEKATGKKAPAVKRNQKVQSWAKDRFKDDKKAAAFADWFGDSKVVDKDGNPLRVYHGTGAQFDKFDSGGKQSGAVLGYGLYFSDNPERAAAYAGKGEGAQVKPVFVSAKTPMDLDGSLSVDQAERVGDELAKAQGDKKSLLLSPRVNKSFKSADDGKAFYRNKVDEWNKIGDKVDRTKPSVEKQGDTFLVHYRDSSRISVPTNAAEAFRDIYALHGPDSSTILSRAGFDSVKRGDEWVVFKPTQIKSATGNKGTFDPDNPDIREATVDPFFTIPPIPPRGGVTTSPLPDDPRRRFGPLAVDIEDEPVRKGGLSQKEFEELMGEILFPPPSEQLVNDWVFSSGWAERLSNLSKQIANPDQLAGELAFGISTGENVQQLTERVKAATGVAASSAKRIARTEAMRVAGNAQNRSFTALGDLQVGLMHHSQIDQNSRPEHAALNGRIYYNPDDGRQPTTDEMVIEPGQDRLPNCRCWHSPVLREPDEVRDDPLVRADFENATGDEIPDPSAYDQWFAQAPEDVRRQAVGRTRYRVAKETLGREPDWIDFVDTEGSLLSPTTIAKESPDVRFQRRQEVYAMLRARQQQFIQVSSQGFVFSR